jgi:hypothetical protein
MSEEQSEATIQIQRIKKALLSPKLIKKRAKIKKDILEGSLSPV